MRSKTLCVASSKCQSFWSDAARIIFSNLLNFNWPHDPARRDEDADGRFFRETQSHGAYPNARHSISIGNKGWRRGPSIAGNHPTQRPPYASHRGIGAIPSDGYRLI
jgi:hypothetical protein